jgi:cobalt-zinc-cadmium efflux system membrane fusion protein
MCLLDVAAGCRGGAAKVPDDDDHAHAGEARDDDHAPGIIELTPEQAAAAKIAVAPVERRALAAAIEATAEIQPTGDGVARVGARVAGRVTGFKAAVGDRVTRGQVLVVVDSPELGRAKADFLGALALAKVTRDSADRERALFEKQISSERDWRQAEAEAIKARAEKEAAENRLHTLGMSDAELARLRADAHYSSTTTAVSPIDGVVVERPVTLGQMVDPTTTLFTIMDLAQVWVLVDVYERDLAQVQLGQTAVARVTSYPERSFTGTVTHIGAVVEPRTRTIRVRVALPNEGGALKPGMFARVTLAGTSGEPRAGLFLPGAAVQRSGDESLVFVQRGPNRFEKRDVELGRTSGELVEIVDGIAEGDAVVIGGSFLLKSELHKERLGGGHSH